MTEMHDEKAMKAALEAMMFVWGEPLDMKEAASALETTKEEVTRLCRELQNEYESEGRGIAVREINGRFQFVTRPEEDIFIKKLCTPVRVKRLSQAALEVLAIVAYRQPVTRGEVDSIRGIKSERVLDGLISKGLIKEAGRSDGVGRPILYRTTDYFLRKFGFSSLKDLPDIEELSDDEEGEESEKVHEQISLDFDEDK